MSEESERNNDTLNCLPSLSPSTVDLDEKVFRTTEHVLEVLSSPINYQVQESAHLMTVVTNSTPEVVSTDITISANGETKEHVLEVQPKSLLVLEVVNGEVVSTEHVLEVQSSPINYQVQESAHLLTDVSNSTPEVVSTDITSSANGETEEGSKTVTKGDGFEATIDEDTGRYVLSP